MPEDSTEQLARLWTKSQPIVASYILSLVPDHHRAEDILQQVAVVIVREFEQYDSSRPFLAWALGIARNLVLKSRRKYAKESSRCIFDIGVVERVEAAFLQHEDELSEFRQSLRDCLKQLRNRDLEVLRWRYVYNFAAQEVARKMGLTSGAVRVMLHRVRRFLRECVHRRMEASE